MDDEQRLQSTDGPMQKRTENEKPTPPPHRMPAQHQGVQIECAAGDITQQADVQAIVNAANEQLLPGGGVAGAIHRAAGPGLASECRPLAPIKPGDAVITGGHALAIPYVIHCLGPVYGVDHPAPILLANCYRNALQLADEKGIESIAFPAISTGAFGYPFLEATEIACRTVLETASVLRRVNRIRLLFTSAVSANIACTLLGQLSRGRS